MVVAHRVTRPHESLAFLRRQHLIPCLIDVGDLHGLRGVAGDANGKRSGRGARDRLETKRDHRRRFAAGDDAPEVERVGRLERLRLPLGDLAGAKHLDRDAAGFPLGL